MNHGQGEWAGLSDATRDESWLIERRQELLRAVAQVEKQTIGANIVGTALIAAFAQTLPNAGSFLFAIMFRFATILLTNLAYGQLRKQISSGAATRWNIMTIIGVSLLGGGSWALLLLPVFTDPMLHPGAFLVCSGVMICVGLVVAHTSSMPYFWSAFLLSFLAVLFVGLTAAPEPMRWPIGIGISAIVTAIAIFSMGAARQRIETADTLVHNQRLREDLSEALAQAEFLATRDPLTGLYSRRAVFESPPHSDTANSARHALLVDVDRFKQVNDRFGHDTGDRLLVAIADMFRAEMAQIDNGKSFVARLGGEEFAVILDTADPVEADAAAELFRQQIERVAKDFSMPESIATASIGVSTIEAGETIAVGLQRADSALYEAKGAGRNTVRRRNRNS